VTAAAQPRLHALTAMAAGAGDPEIELEHERARATAEEGAALARAAGFDAKAYSLRTDGSIGEAIVDCADRHPTRLVVIGTRGLSGVRLGADGQRHAAPHAERPRALVRRSPGNDRERVRQR
jgi:nucleotide-binding universal stress UspA family protein